MVNKTIISKTLLFTLCLIILSIIKSSILFCQEVLKPPKYPDGIYTKECSRSRYPFDILTTLTWNKLKTPFYSLDTNDVKRAEIKINYFKKYFFPPPIYLEECIYISPAKSSGFSLINQLRSDNSNDIIDDYAILDMKTIKYDADSNIVSIPDKKKNKFVSPIFPSSFLFYSDTLNSEDKNNPTSEYFMHLKLNKPIEDFYQPFYFKKTEVTNKEYREFVYWVLDSIARQSLAYEGLKEFLLHPEDPNDFSFNKKTIIDWNDQNIREILEFMYLPPEERFYSRKQFDSRKINYEYTRYDGTKDRINVYPDTLAWINDFNFELFTNMYFWHAAYNDFPVVGITQKQAIAFLIWKTKQAQEELDAKHSNYIIEYKLPSEMEWEMVATKSKSTIYSPEYIHFYDNDFATSLVLKEDTCNTTFKTIKVNNHEGGTKQYKITFPANIQQKSILYAQGGLLSEKIYLFKSNLNYDKKNALPELIKSTYKDENGVTFMGGNVSEWMADTYKENWLPIYTYHQNKLKRMNTKYSKQLLEIENIYNSQNDTSGVLVRGGNWFDISLSNIAHKNFDGINKKIFLDPDKAYSTLGFRYIVRVHRKDEKVLLVEKK